MMTRADTYTHGHHDSVLRSHRSRTAENSAGYLLQHLRPGQALLDIGCGPGTITLDLATRVDPGQTVGLDRAELPLVQARAMAREQEKAAPLSGAWEGPANAFNRMEVSVQVLPL